MDASRGPDARRVTIAPVSHRGVAAAACAGAVLLAGCGGSSSSTSGTGALAAACRAGNGVNGHATTKSYVIQVNVGPIESMYSPDEVAAQHPSGGEIMLKGQMTPTGGSTAGMPGMGGGAGALDHHLEAHICSRTAGSPVENANPTITVIDAAAANAPIDVPIAVMQGVGQGPGDYHYGNNVKLTPGGSYTVIVSLSGETADFHIRLPPPG